MIVDEITGDLFKTDCQTIVCPVNTIGVMGKGLALYAKMRWPYILLPYQNFCRGKRFVDSLLLIPISDNKQLLLLPTKKHWKEDSNEWILSHSLKLLVKHYKKYNIESLAIPKIGCGCGNMEFDNVRKLLHKYLDPVELPVKIYI